MIRPLPLLATADPVAAFDLAHRTGRLIALTTAGTSAAPRTVVRRTGSWVDSFPAYATLTGLDSASRVWIPGPLTATMNLFAAVVAHWAGATVTDALEGASHLQVTPTALRRLLDQGSDLHGRTIVVAGAALDAGLRVRAERAGARVCHYYGSAELSFVGWGADSAGLLPFPGVEVRVVDGVIWARSPYLAEGVPTDAEGFATVGDRGRFVAGRLTVAGRDDAVTTAGLTVRLAEVEAALRPGLRGDLAVVGVPHPRLGAVVTAVLTDAADRDPARAAASTVGPGRPRRWVVLPALPITDAGKIDRAALVRLVGS